MTQILMMQYLSESNLKFDKIILNRYELQLFDLSLNRFIPQLPHQAAFCLYNYLIGYIMFYVRTPREQGEVLIGSAMSLLWMVVHSVQGIGLKDLKQILRKEQV